MAETARAEAWSGWVRSKAKQIRPPGTVTDIKSIQDDLRYMDQSYNSLAHSPQLAFPAGYLLEGYSVVQATKLRKKET